MELGNRGMHHIVNKVPYLRDCLDDLSSNARLMRKWMEETPQIVYGPELCVEVEFLQARFTDWKKEHNIKSTNAGPYLDWTATAVEDAFGYAERRLSNIPASEGFTIEPKDVTGVPPRGHPLQTVQMKKVFNGIGWQEREGPPSGGPHGPDHHYHQAPADRMSHRFL